MTCLSVSLDPLAAWREALGGGVDLVTAASLVDLAGADRIRLGVNEELQPVTESDLQRVLQVVPRLELCISPSPHLLRLALEVRPARVLLVDEDRYRRFSYAPLDLRKSTSEVTSIVRSLQEADIATGVIIAPEIEQLKAAHSIGFGGVDLCTRYAADLPEAQRAQELERLSDAALLAAKLKFYLGVGGGLDYRNVEEVGNAVPTAVQVEVGRAVIVRGLLVGLDRAVRDFKNLIS